MNGFLYIYLAGNIKKGKEDEHEETWDESAMHLLQSRVKSKTIVFLNPAERSDDLSNQKSVFGRDLFQVYSSDIVLVDGRSKRGLGVGSEMMFAKINSIPVITWVPENSHYHRQTIDLLGQVVSPWVHPFVLNLSDFIALSLEKAAQWIDEVFVTSKAKVKGPESLKEAINYYLDAQLENDVGMNQLVSSQEHFNQKRSALECFSESF